MKWLRFPDLVGRGIINSRMTLHRLIRDHEFPPGVLITPNARAWDEAEVDERIASRPTAKKPSTRQPKAAQVSA